MRRLCGFLFGLLLFLSSLLGSIFILVPFIPLTVISPQLWRFCADRFVGYWLTFPASLCELLFNAKFHVTGDLINRHEPALIIMNHRTRLDWLYFWNALYKMDPWLLTSEKIMLKAPLKLLPGAGWAMQCASYLFLERKFDVDKVVIDKMISYYKSIGKPYQLLLFPEGTDRSEHTAKISDAFAKENNLPTYHYVLHPRTTGFAFLLQNMRRKDYIKYVYDVTVGYSKEIVLRETDILKNGFFPSEVHFDVKKFAVDDIPCDNEKDISTWLCGVWKKKEARLAQFYNEDKMFLPSGDRLMWPVKTIGFGYYCAFIFWILSSCFWIYLTYCYMKMSEPERVRTTGFVDKVKGFTTSCLVLSSALFGSFYILLPLLPLMFFSHDVWRKVIDRLLGFWLILPSGIIEFLYRVKFTVTGKEIEFHEPALIIMNHRTRLDWLFFWNALLRIDPWLLTSEKISLKGILKYLPGAGWGMSCGMYIFLDRSFENDCTRIEAMLNYYANSGYNYQLLLFPEGTDKCEIATERNRVYSLKNGLVHYAHVLHPRTTGFTFIVKKMRELGYIKNIYDVTVAYPDTIVQSEVDFFQLGACPKNVHFDIRKIDINSLPNSKEDLSEWLIEHWKRKEERLNRFFSEENVSKRHLDTEENAQLFEMTTGNRMVQVGVVTFWVFSTAVWSYAFWMYRSQMILAAFACVVFIGSLILYDGIEWVAIRAAATSQSRELRMTKCNRFPFSPNDVRYEDTKKFE